MKETIAVIAANGRSGQACVEALLAAGYQVRAGVRCGNGSDAQHRPGLTVWRCDATKAEDIDRLLEGADAVVNMIGHTRRSSADVQTLATAHCIAYIQAHRPAMRLISLTGTGVRQPGDRITVLDWLGNFVIGLIDPARIRDGIRHAELLERSAVNYTVVRVLKLTNGRQRRKATLTLHGPVESVTSRARVAAMVVELLQSSGFERTMPVVSRTHR